MSANSNLGKSYPRVDAADKVSGRIQYASDIYLPGMLMCKVLQSPKAHARIVRIDTSRAAQLPGVRAVITGQDVPDAYFGNGAVHDKRILARDKVRYIGEPVAAVAAVDEMTAQEALELIDVIYEDLPAVTDPLDALRPDAPLVHEDLPSYHGFAEGMGGNICTTLSNECGDVDAAFAQADHLFEDTFRSQGINQGYLEAMACVANVDPSGRINVWTSTQAPYQIRATLATVVNCPLSRLRIIPMEMGGGFGAKLRLCVEAYPVLLSMCTGGKPVKLIATREETFTLSGFRLPTIVYLKTGVMQDGRIVAREAISIFDMGAHLGAGVQSGVSHTLGPYNIPNFRMRSYAVYTNKIWAGSYRASGVADVTFAVESHADIVARKLGMDPWEFRKRNAFQEGDLALQGGAIPANGLHQTMEAIKTHMALPRKPEAGTGIGLAMCQWRSGSGPSTASVSIQEDGTVSLLTGSVDITGTDTVFAQIVAEALGIDVSQVVIAKRDTDLAPFTGPSGGSRITYSQGKTVQMATEDAKEKLVALAADLLDVQPQMLTCTDGGVQVSDDPTKRLSLAQLARRSVATSGPIIGTASLSAMPFAPIFSTQAAEVKVDKDTGRIRILRFAQAQDVGVAINPMAIEGQIDGGVVQGIGRAISEEVVIKDGEILNPSLTTYLMPMAADVPSIENILVEVPTEDGPFGARAVAEPPGFGPPAAIANAIEDAVGVRLKSLPLSAEKILNALRGETVEATDIDPELLQRLRQ